MTVVDLLDATKRAPTSLWGQQVFSAAMELRGRLSLADDPSALPAREVGIRNEVLGLIESALDLAAAKPAKSVRIRLHEWWSGKRVELCWAYLHAAEVHLAGSHEAAVWQATARSAVDHAHRLPADDTDRSTLEQLVRGT